MYLQSKTHYLTLMLMSLVLFYSGFSFLALIVRLLILFLSLSWLYHFANSKALSSFGFTINSLWSADTFRLFLPKSLTLAYFSATISLSLILNCFSQISPQRATFTEHIDSSTTVRFLLSFWSPLIFTTSVSFASIMTPITSTCLNAGMFSRSLILVN